MNYFNYFTEIEDSFVRRRGKHLLLSPMDWALIESWKEMGVPLYVALRAIERSFDSFDAKPRRRSVKTLLYCQEEVEAQFAEWRESQVGAGSNNANGDNAIVESSEADAQLPFPRALILGHLNRATANLKQLQADRPGAKEDEFCETLTRIISRLDELKSDFEVAVQPNAERLEDSLAGLEKLLDESLLAQLSAEDLAAMRNETKTQLSSYRSRMDVEMYKQTFDNLLLKRLREQYNIPRLSLFYL